MTTMPLQPEQIQVLIIGGSALMRAGLRTILLEQSVNVLGVAQTMTDLADQIILCDVLIVLDLEILSVAEHPPAILVINDEVPYKLPQGTWGMLRSDATPQEILVALQALVLGLTVIPPQIFAQLNANPLQSSETLEPLSQREREVLQLLAEGLTNRQIALRLNISEHTVKFHCSAIFSKLNAASRTEAIRIGMQSGLISW